MAIGNRHSQETERAGHSPTVTREAGIRMAIVPDLLAAVMEERRMAEEIPAAIRDREMNVPRAVTETGNRMTAVLLEEARAA